MPSNSRITELVCRTAGLSDCAINAQCPSCGCKFTSAAVYEFKEEDEMEEEEK